MKIRRFLFISCMAFSVMAQAAPVTAPAPMPAKAVRGPGLDAACAGKVESLGHACDGPFQDAMDQCQRGKLSASCSGQMSARGGAVSDAACLHELEVIVAECLPRGTVAAEQCRRPILGDQCTEDLVNYASALETARSACEEATRAWSAKVSACRSAAIGKDKDLCLDTVAAPKEACEDFEKLLDR